MDSLENAAGSLAARARELGARSRVGAPIVVDERVWGMAIVGWSRPEPLPADTEERISDFAELVATALANAATRAELIASRARIVAAADDARRRLERDLHDGAQQRAVSLGLRARMAAERLVLPEQTELKQELSDLASGLNGLSTELQEISRGIHPAILSEGGLGPALKALARRSTLPVSFEVAIEQRLSDAVEIAAYYVVAEALTNAAKHAQASQVNVRAEIADSTLRLSIQDDGIGGADFRKGSGLIGLKDRVEALGGQLKVTSQPGSGTSLDIAIRLDDDVE
jgi:signal transduction histidine kinase